MTPQAILHVFEYKAQKSALRILQKLPNSVDKIF